jgi:hypothetical protein
MDHSAALFLLVVAGLTGVAAVVFALIVRPARRRT